jgi:hypothetical protein
MSLDNPTTAPSIFQAEDCSSSLCPSVTWTGVGSSFAFYTTELASSSELAMPKAGKVTVRFMSLVTAFDDELWLAHPLELLINKTSSHNLGQPYDVGTFAAGTGLVFALKMHDGQAYYTDSSLNRDGCDHVRRLQLGTDRW